MFVLNLFVCSMPLLVPMGDLTASLLSKVCSDVGVEPSLQPVEGEPLQFATANGEDGAHLNVVARDFWGQNRQRVFLMSGCSTLMHAQLLSSFPIVQMLFVT